ncbi:DNA mismatch repair endonuclease MutL [Desulfurobacterium thermolithotrophum]|uniref:DNA mismatch repair endonuclease MutL n=1 Tax=Desulfurobacterium thermolithotrophum TaxID=64160 RepID=UPI0013D3C613|nr:DNA mismatch repair endonuclease MutL [Desulfurobacterium thermolithotrophum]
MIKRLPPEIISKIASGQIASSPMNVLKELIENAIDAKATEILIRIKDHFNFKVTDNGIGIPYKELPTAVERFTTSKISTIRDLSQINTYGFRGEALYAISQVSHLTIKSRFQEESIGGKLEVKGGKILSHSPISFSRGTSVLVNSLYFNVPVRKKCFDLREKRNLKKIVKTFALCRPEITFKLDNEVFFASSLEERIRQIFGKEITFEKELSKRFTIFYLTEKEEGRRKINFIFVNKRPVSLPEVERVLSELNIKNYILFINVTPEEVDVNVTPTKDKVILRYFSILEEMKNLLAKKVFLPTFPVLREKKEINYQTPIEVLGSDGTIIVAHDSEYFYFFDQHLIHERVNYEELISLLFSKKVPLKRISPPMEVGFSVKLTDKLEKFGIEYEKVGKTIFIHSIPEILRVEDIKRIINGETPKSIAEIACKKAIKSGYKPLNFNDIKELFEKYLLCKNRETCPHGRPIYYRIKKSKIMRKVGRN